MKGSNVRWVLFALSTFLLAGPLASGQTIKPDSQRFIAATADQLALGGAGGPNSIVIAGDPNKPGLYVLRMRFAPGTGSRPHYHDQDRYVTVIKGTWWVSLGSPEADTYQPEKMVPMKAGSFVFHPAFGHHYDGAKDEEAIVQIMGMGPVKTINLENGAGPRPTGTTSRAPSPAPGTR